MSARVRIATVVLACALACACSDDGADGQSPDAGADAGAQDAAAAAGDAATSQPSAVSGTFELRLVAAVPAMGDVPETPAFATISGRATEGEEPATLPFTMAAEEGGCELFVPSTPFCDPPCTGGAVCVEDGVCAAYPRSLDLGTVTLRGVRTQAGEERVSLQPLPPRNNYMQPGSVRFEYPPFEAGAEITLEAEGGDVPPFSITASGIEPLELIGEGDLPFAPDTATELRWVAPSAGESRIAVRVDLSHHGGQKGELVCDVEDSGRFEIPAAIGTQLIELGVAGYPSLEITRVASGSAAVGPGRITFEITSPVVRELQIPGLVSCDLPGEQDVCPDGQLCGMDRRCQ